MFRVPDSRTASQDGEKAPFECWMAMRATVDCVVCFDAMDATKKWPSSGRCGHTICFDCLEERITKGISRPSQFLTCPIGSCLKPFSFERTYTKNVSMVEAIGKLKEIESGVMLNLQRIAYDNERAVKHLQQQQQEKESFYVSRIQTLENQLSAKESQLATLLNPATATIASVPGSQNFREDQFDW